MAAGALSPATAMAGGGGGLPEAELRMSARLCQVLLAASVGISGAVLTKQRRSRRRAGALKKICCFAIPDPQEYRAAGQAPPKAKAAPTDYYSLLGLPLFVEDPEEVRKAYHRLVKMVHPDVLGGDTKDLTFLLTSAYKTLSDANEKAKYDGELEKSAVGQRKLSQMVEQQDYNTGEWKWMPKTPEQSIHSTWNPDCEDLPEDVGAAFVDQNYCIGCYNCIECAPNTFKMEMKDSHSGARARVVEQYADSAEDIHWAVESCPTNAISIVDKEDIGILEDFMAACKVASPERVFAMLSSRMVGKGGGEDPFHMLHMFKGGQEMPGFISKKTGWVDPRKEYQGIGRTKADEQARRIRDAVEQVPDEVREQAWPSAEAPAGNTYVDFDDDEDGQ